MMTAFGWFQRYYHLSVAFYIGFASAIGQVLLIRELLTVFRGNEFIIGVIFTGWFLGVFFGARFNSVSSNDVLEKRVVLSYLAFPLVLLAFVHFIHLIPIFMRRTPGNFFPLTAEFALSFFFTIPVSFFVGYFFPPLVTLYANRVKEKSGGMIYLIESFGACVGGILFSFVFIELLNPMGICAILIACAFAIFIAQSGKKWLAGLIIIPCFLFYFSEDVERTLFRYVWNKTQASTLLRYDRTKYQTIFLGYNDQQISVYGDGVLYYTIPDRYEIRHLFHFIQALRNGKKNEELILFGSGPGSLPYNLLRTDISTLAYFEIDPKLFRTIEPYRIRFYRTGPEDNRLAVISQDLRYFLKNSDERFHMIICFPPPPHNANLNRYYTKEFFQMCREKLKSDGIFITSLSGFSSALEREQRDYLASIYRSFSKVFPTHLKTSGEIIYLVGVNGNPSVSLDPERILKNYSQRSMALKKMPIETALLENFSPTELSVFFEKTRIEYFNNTVVPYASHIAENTDRQPFAYWRYILHSAAKERSLLYGILKNYEYFLIFLLAITALVLSWVLKKHGFLQFAGSFLIFVIGMSSMAGVLIMIMLYQNFYGVVYYRISLINALFMLGLTVGSFLATRFNIQTLVGIKVGMVVTLGALFVFTYVGSEFLFWPILIVFSTLCGIAFPALFSLLSKGNYQTTASNLDSMEFFGSIIGSVGTTVFLPMLGIELLLMSVMGVLIFAIPVSRYVSSRSFGI
ncbi:MAG: hypothetical protein N2316_11845 [Spirochaetes bacterium]|nr:hypothetical protein [Spirochaetota bacterium]